MTTVQAQRRGRTGFTLVELLVVIVIITALAAIIIPAVYVTVGKAKQARIGLEVANLARALERYKMEYGEYPPDFTAAWEHSQDAMNVAKVKDIINAHLSTNFRRRDTANDLPRDEELAALNPSTALIFWLKGFSPNPQYPLTGTGDRSPFFDFDKGRASPPLTNPPLSQLPQHVFEYFPNGDSSKRPYIYYSGASYGSYDPRNSNNPLDPQQPTYLILDFAKHFRHLPPVDEPRPFCPPYFSSTEQRFAEPEKFQIISAGLDGTYDDQELADIRNSFQDYPTVPVAGRTVSKPLKDNLASFSEGIIGDMIEE